MTGGSVQLRGGSTIRVDTEALKAYADALLRLASLIDRDAGRLLRQLGALPTMAAGSVTDPAGAAEVAGHASACLLLGVAASAGCYELALGLRAAASAYDAVDSALARARPMVKATAALPQAITAATLTHDPQRLITGDPELVAAGIGLLSVAAAGPAAGSPSTVSAIAGALSLPYRDGAPQLTAHPGAPTVDGAGAPRCTADLLTALQEREADDDGGGAIDVRILEGEQPGSGRRVIVDITGTTSWDADPLHTSRQATDLATNLRSLGDEPSVMSRGVIQALHRAGVGSQDEIMLVGHSQGGMVAAEVAGELHRSGAFRVTQLLTAGSPIALSDVPAGISVLSLENSGDPVPKLDGADNPARRSWLTAQVSEGGASVLQQHSIAAYLAGAKDFDRDRDPAVQDWQNGARQFFDAAGVQSQVFRIERS
jgi:pimeloyl-ACP methyl ester carboxylesterase